MLPLWALYSVCNTLLFFILLLFLQEVVCYIHAENAKSSIQWLRVDSSACMCWSSCSGMMCTKPYSLQICSWKTTSAIAILVSFTSAIVFSLFALSYSSIHSSIFRTCWIPFGFIGLLEPTSYCWVRPGFTLNQTPVCCRATNSHIHTKGCFQITT